MAIRMPFSAAVNVGTEYDDASWLDTQGLGTIAHQNFTNVNWHNMKAWNKLSKTQQDEIIARHPVFRKELAAANKFVAAWHLHQPHEAKTVSQDAAGNITVANGPFFAQNDVIGGAYLIESDSMEEAVDWAKKGRFMSGANEVRQIWE